MKAAYICQECGHSQAKWGGRCDGCGEWNSLEETMVESKSSATRSPMPVRKAEVSPLSEHSPARYPRFPSGSEEVDRVLGGGFVPGSLVIISAEPGAGKALALDTPLPTPSGWTTMGEVEAGQYLIDEWGKPCKVLAVSEIMEYRTVYRVKFQDGSTIVADENHLWLTSTRECPRKVYSTGEIKQSLKVGGSLNHAVALPQAIQGEEIPLEEDPYTLGLQLGFSGGESLDAESIEYAKRLGYPVYTTGGRAKVGVSQRPGRDRRKRSIPTKYQRASIPQRRLLLAGLMDAKGHISGEGSNVEFHSHDPKLIQQVSELVLSLGYAPVVCKKQVWTLAFKAFDCTPFSLDAKSAAWSPSQDCQERFISDVTLVDSVKVRCVQVSSESRLYLAGRSMIPTHNSTISSKIVDHLAGAGKKVLYMAGEESGAQIRLRIERMGLTNSDKVSLTDEIELNSLAETLQSGYDFAVIDSLQTIYDANMSSAAGTPSVLKQIGQTLTRVAKTNGVTILLVGHVTKDGTLAGPRHVEHMVDVVLHLEGERSQGLRILRAAKNRFGATDEIGVFEMTEEGLLDVNDPSLLLLGEHSEKVPGMVVCPSLEGSRPVLVEVQALSQSVAFQGAPPARRPRGIDRNRLDMLLAVLSRHSRMSLGLGGKDIYVNIGGGMRVDEPAIDLAICVAVVSAVTGRPVRDSASVWGEVSLLGEVRPVRGDAKRRNEVERLGYGDIVAPRPRARPMPLSQALQMVLEKESLREDDQKEEYSSFKASNEDLPAPPILRHTQE